jgi:hypothetical protein
VLCVEGLVIFFAVLVFLLICLLSKSELSAGNGALAAVFLSGWASAA